MKRTIFKRVIIAVVLLLGAASASAHDFEVDGIYYNKNEDGTTVSVTFRGSSYKAYADEYTGDVVIPSSVKYSGITYSVTSIGDDAFRNCSRLTSVTIPNSVISIGEYTFSSCSGLTSFTIPNSINSIGYQAFVGCSGLTRVDISSLEAWLGIEFSTGGSSPLDYAHHLYLNGEEVKDLVIPNSVTSIGNFAFYRCSGLTSVTIPNSVTSIGWHAFNGCSGLTSVTIPNSVETIDGYAFNGCSGLTSVNISNSVTSIGMYAFYGCSGLTSVNIPSSVETIGNNAFQSCNGLTSVNIGNSVTSIGNKAFSGCSGLTSVTIPNSVTSIGDQVFYGCSGLKSATIPNSVTEIGEAAFSGCSGLTSVTIPNSVTSIGNSAFSGCSGLTSVTIPNSVKTIGNSAFSGCSCLTSVTIGNSVTSIGVQTFYGCSGLTSVTIPNSVTSIGDYAFYECSGLTSVTIPNSVKTIGNYTFYECSGLKGVNIGNSVTSIGESAFYKCSGLTSVTIPNSVTSISKFVFYGCSGLTSVTIPNSVTSIGDEAFRDCSGLTSVTIPNSVKSIGDDAFWSCSGLKTILYNAENCADVNENSYVFTFWSSNLKIIIGKDVKKVPNYLFYSLHYAPKRVISQSVTPPTCGANTFNSDAYTAKLYVPSEAEADYFLADVWCDFDIATVDKPITAIALSESEATIALGSTKQLTATATPSDATIADIFEWSSSNPEVAVVDGNGLVTAVGEGTTVITAKAFDGSEVTGSCNITVRSFNATSITLNYTELNMFEKEYTTLTYAILPEDATVKTAEWSVSDDNVLTYREMSDGSLKIVAKSAGTATVTARTTDGSNLEATCVVTVNPVAANVNQIKPGTNKVKFALQGVKMHNGVLYACTTAKSVNMSTPTLHGNDANNMAPYEDRNFAEFDQRDWVAISGLEEGFVGKELSYPFEANFADGVLTPSETISATAEATAYNLNTFRAENILHGGYSNYAEGDYKAYYVPARVNEVAKFMGLIETVGGVKYLYSNNTYGRKDGEGIKVEGTIADNSKVYSILEGILVADATTKAGVKIIMLDYVGQATGVEGVDAAAARIYSANGNIVIATTEDGDAAVYDFTGRLIKSVLVVAGDNTTVPIMPGCYIVRTGVKTQSVVVK